MNPRKVRGLEIATKLKLVSKGKTWLLPSQSGRGKYTVDLSAEPASCTCPDYEINRSKCKHIFAVEFKQEQQGGVQTDSAKTTPALSEPKKRKPTYKQKWSEYNSAQTTEKKIFQEFLHQLCQGIAEPDRPRGRGRPPLPINEAVFCGALKVYSLFSSRRFTPDLEAAHARKYISRVPHYNTIIDYLLKSDG